MARSWCVCRIQVGIRGSWETIPNGRWTCAHHWKEIHYAENDTGPWHFHFLPLYRTRLRWCWKANSWWDHNRNWRWKMDLDKPAENRISNTYSFAASRARNHRSTQKWPAMFESGLSSSGIEQSEDEFLFKRDRWWMWHQKEDDLPYSATYFRDYSDINEWCSDRDRCKMLGHRNLKTTQHYAKILDLKVSEDMGLLRAKLNKNASNKNDLKENL
jgi:hypothetical protein